MSSRGLDISPGFVARMRSRSDIGRARTETDEVVLDVLQGGRKEYVHEIAADSRSQQKAGEISRLEVQTFQIRICARSQAGQD